MSRPVEVELGGVTVLIVAFFSVAALILLGFTAINTGRIATALEAHTTATEVE